MSKLPGVLVNVLVTCVAAATTTTIAAAQPSAKPKALASYCSTTGDLCLGIVNRDGAVYFGIELAGAYFARYDLCVRPPRGGETCRNFPIRKRKLARYTRNWSYVRWHRNFPARGAGVYAVTWKYKGQRVAPTLASGCHSLGKAPGTQPSLARARALSGANA